jgi:peptide/nickel transport system substrate-binding protein
VQFAYPNSIEFDHYAVLKREWEMTRKGVATFVPEGSSTHAVVQFRPEYQKSPALIDLRVRKAMMHAVDKAALNDGLFEGDGIIAHTAIFPSEPYFPDVDRAIGKYDYDPRRTEALMNEAGYFKDSQGFFANTAGERFRPDSQALAGVVFERGQAIVVNSWARAGIETVPSVLPNALSRDPMNRHTFPGLGGSQNGVREAFTAEQIGTPENRWAGNNRGGWTDPEYERLWTAFNTTLPRSERDQLQVRMAAMATEKLPSFMLYFLGSSYAQVAELSGPRLPNIWWTVNEWELR